MCPLLANAWRLASTNVAVLLMLASAAMLLVLEMQLVAAGVDEESCPPEEYQVRPPKTREDFRRVVRLSDEAFLVRFTNKTDLECMNVMGTWEKLALMEKDRIRLMTYEISPKNSDAENAAIEELMSKLGVLKEGLPNWRLYHSLVDPEAKRNYIARRNRKSQNKKKEACDDDASNDECSSISAGSPLPKLDDDDVEAQEQGPWASPIAEGSVFGGEDSAEGVDPADEGLPLEQRVLPPAHVRVARHQRAQEEKARREKEEEEALQEEQRQLDAEEKSGKKPQPYTRGDPASFTHLMRGYGAAYSQLRPVVEKLTKGAVVGSNGFLLKKQWIGDEDV